MWIEASQKGALLYVHVQPQAGRTEIVGVVEGATSGSPGQQKQRLKIKLKAPPVEGAANEELIRFLSRIFDLKQSSIVLLRGESSRQKDILLLTQISIDDMKRMLKKD